MNRTAILLIFAVSVTLAAEVVAHSPACQQTFNKFGFLAGSSTPHKHHSAETIKKWKEWRDKHPNWKPKSKETLLAINFACNVEDVPVDTDVALDVAPPITFSPDIHLDEMQLIPDNTVEPLYGTYPSETIYGTDTGGSGGYPLIYTAFTVPPAVPGRPAPPPVVPPAPVPEPATLALLGSGFVGLVALIRRRVK
jgi:PEP-CTERM motif